MGFKELQGIPENFGGLERVSRNLKRGFSEYRMISGRSEKLQRTSVEFRGFQMLLGGLRHTTERFRGVPSNNER